MMHTTPQRPFQYPLISVSGGIRLGQFLKLAGLMEDGAQARIVIQSGDVTVNGVVETRRRHHLNGGDVVVIDYSAGQVGAAVEQLGLGQ